MADGAREEVVDAREVADALKISKRGVIKRAGKDAWPYVEARASGGLRRNYPLSTLPEDVRAAVARHRALQAASNAPQSAAEAAGRQAARSLNVAEQVDELVRQRRRERGQAAAAALTGRAAERMQAKTELLGRLDAFSQVMGTGKCAAMEAFCDAYNSGALDVSLQVRMHTGGDLHPATLRRWQRALRTEGTVALAGAYGNRKGTGMIDRTPELRAFVLGLLVDQPHASAKQLRDAIAAALPGQVPPARTLQRYLQQWKRDNASLFLAATNPDAWKNKRMPGFGSYSEGVTRINQRWELDSTPADIMLQDGRHSLVGVIDVATRRMRLLVSKTSTAEAVCRLTRDAIIAWGVPESIKIDNGRDYASERYAGMMRGLEVQVNFSAPFSPWQKPHIERGFKTFSHGLLTMLEGYIGHDVAEAQAIRARQSFSERMFTKSASLEVRMTAADLQAFCDAWCERVYAHEPHDGLEGMTPFQVAASLRDTVRVVQDVRALDMLMGAGAKATVQKKGIRYEKLTYIAPELGPLVGEAVLVRRDEGDVGRLVVYHQDQFLCIAQCPEITGVSLSEISAESRRLSREHVQEGKRELRRMKSALGTREVGLRILEARAAQAEALVALPPPNVAYLTPAIEAASEAAAALDAHDRGEQTPAEREAMFDGFARAARDEQVQDTSAEARFEDALQKQLRLPELNDLERQKLKVYMTSAEYIARWEMLETEGAEWLGLSSEYNALIPPDALFHTHKQGAY